MKLTSPKQASKHFGIAPVHRQEDHLTGKKEIFLSLFLVHFIDALNISESKGGSWLAAEDEEIDPDETFEDSGAYYFSVTCFIKSRTRSQILYHHLKAELDDAH